MDIKFRTLFLGLFLTLLTEIVGHLRDKAGTSKLQDIINDGKFRKINRIVSDVPEKFPEIKTCVIFFQNESLDFVDIFFRSSKIFPKLISTKKTPLGYSRLLSLTSFSVTFLDENLDVLGIMKKNLERIRFSKILLISQRKLKNHLKRLDNKFFELGFVNIAILIFDMMSLLQFELFPEPKFVKVPVNTDVSQLYGDKMKDLKGYGMKTVVKQDPPRVLLSNKKSNGSDQFISMNLMTGTGMEIIKAYLGRHNGSLAPQTYSSFKFFDLHSDCMLPLESEEFEFCANAYGTFSKKNAIASYPYFFNNWCLVVPTKGEKDRYKYWSMIFSEKFLIIFIASFVSFCFIEYSSRKYLLKQENLELSLIFLDNLTRVLYSPNIQCKVGDYVILELIDLMKLATGLVISSFYATMLTTILSTPVPSDVPNSLEAIQKSGIKILLPPFELDILVKLRYMEGSEYLQMFKSEDIDTVYRSRIAWDHKFGYLMTRDKWEFYFAQQKQFHVSDKKYSLTDVCFGCYLLWFPMRIDSPFENSLNKLIFQVSDSGLHSKWVAMSVQEGFNSGLIKMKRSNYTSTYVPLQFGHLRYTWCFYLIAIIFDILSFIFELIGNILFRV